MKPLAWALSNRPAGGGARADWTQNFKASWRRWVRRWSWALIACAMAWCAGMWWHAPTWSEHGQARREVLALQVQLGAVSQEPLQTGKPGMDEALDRLPTTDQSEQWWRHLQKVLAQYRVRLLSMQPVSEGLLAPLPSQAMVMRLQARYENWAQVWRALTEMGPVWSMDRLSVVHSTDAQGVDIEVVWRIWSRTGQEVGDHDKATGLVPMATQPQTPRIQEGPSVFGLPVRRAPPLEAQIKLPDGVQVSAATGVLPEPEGAPDSMPQDLQFTHEPERWPMRPLRLIGIWRQGQQAQAIVANSTHWFRAQEGKALSLEGHRVWRIGGDDMQVRDPQGRVQTIRMEAKAP